MRRISCIAAVVLLTAAWTYGQEPVPGPMEVICPLDKCRFVPPAGESGDRWGGMDSDECWHSVVSQPLPFLVTVCPRCNYAASRGEFVREIPEAKKAELLRMLVKSKYRGVTDTISAIPPWERFRLTAQCATVLDRADDRLAAVKYAAWSARLEACRPATLASMQQARMTLAPVAGTAKVAERIPSRGIGEFIREMEFQVAAAASPAEKNRLSLHLAMMCQRAGFVAKRDAVLATLQSAVPADPSLAGPLNRFLGLLRVEREYQTESIGLLRERVKTEDRPEARAVFTYLLADTLRRLGRDAEAVAEYRAARKLMAQPSAYRIYTDYFLTMLAPGEPLPTPEAPAAEVPAGKEPVSEVPAAPKADDVAK